MQENYSRGRRDHADAHEKKKTESWKSCDKTCYSEPVIPAKCVASQDNGVIPLPRVTIKRDNEPP